MIKYICYCGRVKSVNDGEIHYITAHSLPHLYKINPGDCIFIEQNTTVEKEIKKFKNVKLDNLIRLNPDDTGNYDIEAVHKSDLKTRLKSEIDKIRVPDDYLKMSNQVLLVELHHEVLVIERQVRLKLFDDAMKTAAEIAVKMAIYTSEERV